MKCDGFDSRAALTLFLRERRQRLEPHDAGIRRSGVRRRRTGLRRDEVAELVGVSAHWYSLFESATSSRRFSRAFLTRLMDVLVLDEADRQTLLTLAVASGAVKPDTPLPIDATRLRRILDAVARLSRELAREPDAARAWTIAVAGLRDTVAVSDIYVKVFMADGDARELLLEDARGRAQANRDLVPRSSIAVPIAADGKLHGRIQIDSPEVDAFTVIDATIAATIAKQLAMALLSA